MYRAVHGMTALVVVMLIGCTKDTDEPPTSIEATSLAVRFDLHCNGAPFHPDSLYEDWTGTRIRFEQLRFAFVGACARDQHGAVLGNAPSTVLRLGGILDSGPFAHLVLNNSAAEVHWLDTRTLALADTVGVAGEESWTQCGSAMRQALLELRGTIDGNDDDMIDEDDTPFRIVLIPSEEPLDLRLHIHSSGSGAASELAIAVNVTALVNGLDLIETPTTLGDGPCATQVLNNLRTIVLGADNKPL